MRRISLWQQKQKENSVPEADARVLRVWREQDNLLVILGHHELNLSGSSKKAVTFHLM